MNVNRVGWAHLFVPNNPISLGKRWSRLPNLRRPTEFKEVP
jgi:hypothetical protein